MRFYDDIADDFYGEKADVIVVVRRPDGTETRAATFTNATVCIETATDIGRPHFMLEPATIHQLRVTTVDGFTVYDPTYFQSRKEIEQ